MKEVFVDVNGGYEVLIEKGILSAADKYITKVSRADKVCIVSDSNVFPLYGEALRGVFEDADFEVFTYVFPAGEPSKTPQEAVKITQFLAENSFTRSDLVVALGGGVTGDLAGFAAAIYMRGIDCIQLPTSFLAQVDSSVGGKTAVNLKQGKNLCGAFHQPKLVLIDPHTLSTLPENNFNDGVAEAIKMGCIKSKALFERIENENAHDIAEDIIYECVRLKAEVVERDEKERGERALLNFGHTAGHAIERLNNFENITHGEAVGIGMLLVSEAAEKQGITPQGTADRLAAVLKKYSLPVCDSHLTAEIIGAIRGDKKFTESGINLIVLKEIGNGIIHPVSREGVKAFFGV